MKNSQMIVMRTKKGLCCAVELRHLVKLKKGDKLTEVLLTDSKTVKEMKGE